MTGPIDTIREALTSAKDCDIEHLAVEALAALTEVENKLGDLRAEWLAEQQRAEKFKLLRHKEAEVKWQEHDRAVAAETALAEANQWDDNTRRAWDEEVNRRVAAEQRANDEEDQRATAVKAYFDMQARANDLADALRDISIDSRMSHAMMVRRARAALDRHTQEDVT